MVVHSWRRFFRRFLFDRILKTLEKDNVENELKLGCSLVCIHISMGECSIILSAYTDVKALSIILHSAIILHVKFTILEVFDKLRKSTQRRKSTQYDKQDFSFVYKIFLWIQDYWFNSYGTRYFSVILKIRSKILQYQGFLYPIVFLLSIQYISNIRLHCDSCMTYYITL